MDTHKYELIVLTRDDESRAENQPGDEEVLKMMVRAVGVERRLYNIVCGTALGMGTIVPKVLCPATRNRDATASTMARSGRIE